MELQINCVRIKHAQPVNGIIEILYLLETRMHSSQMHTICCSSHLPRQGRVSAQGVSAQSWGVPGQGVSTKEGVCQEGCLPRGVSARGCLPLPGGSAQGGVSAIGGVYLGVSARGCL